MTNLAKCILPDYRRPKPHEIEACSQYLDKEIEIVKKITTLDCFPAEYIFNKYKLKNDYNFTKICGKTFLLKME